MKSYGKATNSFEGISKDDGGDGSGTQKSSNAKQKIDLDPNI